MPIKIPGALKILLICTDKFALVCMKGFRAMTSNHRFAENAVMQKWRLSQNGRVYAQLYIGKTRAGNAKFKYIFLHKWLADKFLDKPSDKHNIILFKDGDPLNLRLDNMYWATAPEKTRVKKSEIFTSSWNGVYWRKDMKKWACRIVTPDETIYLGTFESEIAAAHAYNVGVKERKLKKYSMNWYTQNFIEVIDDKAYAVKEDKINSPVPRYVLEEKSGRKHWDIRFERLQDYRAAISRSSLNDEVFNGYLYYSISRKKIRFMIVKKKILV